MKPIQGILIICIGVLIIPIFSLVVLSFQNTEGNILIWYKTISNNDIFLSSFRTSFFTSIIVGVLTVIIGFIISISYYNNKGRYITILFILVLGLMPPDIISLSINRFAQTVGFYKSNQFFLYLGLLLYCLPFSIIFMWTRYYYIEKTLFTASEDLGMNNKSIVIKVLIPLSRSSIVSSFLFAFLLSFNEFPRTYYLSGPVVYLSEFLNGKLSSGSDNSIYAGAAMSILITCCIVVVYGVLVKYKNLYKSFR